MEQPKPSKGFKTHFYQRTTKSSSDGKSTKEETKVTDIPSSDIVAVGLLFLMICAGIIAIIMAILMGTKSITSQTGTTVILGCVGGAAIAGIVRAVTTSQKKNKDAGDKEDSRK